MAKKTRFTCQSCGYEAHRWLGRCPGCGEWNCFTEVVSIREKHGRVRPATGNKITPLDEIALDGYERLTTGMTEMDRVLGSGAVAGSVILLGGDPGIGKSTLLLQMAASLAESHRVLYASSEESSAQIKMRAARLGLNSALFVATGTSLEALLDAIVETAPAVLVADSVQAFYRSELDGGPGSVIQVRETAAALIRLAKEKRMVVFLVGHVTKEGTMAGPRLLEHMVDVVLHLEGDRYHSFRILRGVKNRFGSTNEIGVFVMEECGLREVADPSHFFITHRDRSACGAVVTASMEGTRPLLVEIQALVTVSGYATPRRTVSGLDLSRVALLMAVLEKHAGISFAGLDTFVNVTGGVRLAETAVDLTVALALVSSLKGKPAGGTAAVVFGEVGLTGEVFPVSRVAARLAEAEKLGFRKGIIPQANLQELDKENALRIELVGVSTIAEAVGVSLL